MHLQYLIVASTLLLVLSTSAAHAQLQGVPFTAHEGLATAQNAASVGSRQPTVVGINMNVDTNGKAPGWLYHFGTSDTAIIVIQVAPNVFLPAPFALTDTTDFPVYVHGEPLPANWINSDSALAIIKTDGVFQEWFQQYGAQQDLSSTAAVGGRIRAGFIESVEENTPVWFYVTNDSSGTSTLACWCTMDGTRWGCRSSVAQGTPFTAQSGLPSAQEAAQTTEQPCMVVAAAPDTLGLSPLWFYVFPHADSIIAIQTVASQPGSYVSQPTPIEDTTDLGIPLYVRATPFASPWLNSDVAMEYIRQNPTYQEWMQMYRDSIYQPVLAGGRITPEGVTAVSVDVGTAIWWFQAFTFNPEIPILRCWCALEGNTPQFYGCETIVASSVSDNTSVPLSLAPNPTADIAVLHAGQPIDRVTVVSVLGQQLPAAATISGTTALLDVRSLPAGTYTLLVQSGNVVSSQRLVVLR